MKLFSITPADLPPDLKPLLVQWLGSAPAGLEGYIRPGCVFLTLQAVVTQEVADSVHKAGLRRLVALMQSPAAACSFWRRNVLMLQLGQEVAVLAQGRLARHQRYSSPEQLAAGGLPSLSRVEPLCVVAGGAAEARLLGSGLAVDGCQVVARSEGVTYKLPLKGVSDCGGRLACRLPPVPAGACRLFSLEVCKGGYLSEVQHVLLLRDAALAAEVNRLLESPPASLTPDRLAMLLHDLALVLQHAAGAPPKMGLSHSEYADKARRLLAFACDMGWAVVAESVLPLACANCECAHEVVSVVHKVTMHDGLSLLHRVVRSRNSALMRSVLSWGDAHGFDWSRTLNGPHGITPLHIASLLDDDGEIALQLMDAYGPQALTCAMSEDGVSPFHLSFQMGHYGVDKLIQVRLFGVLIPKERPLENMGSALQLKVSSIRCESA